MELPANTPPTSPTELEGLGKEQTLGEAKYLGCPRFETPNAITTTVSRGPTTALTATIQRGQTGTFTATASGSRTTTVSRSPTTALTATTPGGATTI